MSKLRPIHKEFLIRETFVSTIIGAIICAVISFFAFRSNDAIMLWGEDGLFLDLVMTIFFMTFMMTLAMTPMYRKRIMQGKAPAAPWARDEHFALRFFHGVFLLRAFTVAGISLVILLPISTAILVVTIDFPVSFSWMLVFKSIFGALIGFLVTPLIAICAMADKGERQGGFTQTV